MVQTRRKNLSAASHVERLMSLIDKSVESPEEIDWTKNAIPYKPPIKKSSVFQTMLGYMLS